MSSNTNTMSNTNTSSNTKKVSSNTNTISNKKLVIKKKMSYANSVKRTSKLIIKEIPIKEWLKNYGLEEFYDTIFVEKQQYYYYDHEYSSLLNIIKTNVDLLFSFNEETLTKAIDLPISIKLMADYYNGLITNQDDTRSEKYVEQFIKAFNLLQSQKLDYKAMLSIFDQNPSKTQYDNIIETNLDFLDTKHYKDKNIFKDEFIQKLKLINFDDLLCCKQTTFNLLLSLSIDDIMKYMLYTTNKVVKITEGLKPSFTKTQFNNFINGNESLKVFESCYNNYDIKYVNTSLKENFDAKSLLSVHRMDLLEYIFNPSKLIDAEVSENIYATFFPDNDHIYIESQFSRIGKTIPQSKVINTIIKQNKVRVFFIQGHGMACSIEDYKKKNRLDFEKVFGKINHEQSKKVSHPPKYNSNMFNIVSTQPVGRVSYLVFINLFNKIFSSKYRDNFLQGLINANEVTHLRILENIVTMYWNYYCIKHNHITPPEKMSEHLKKSTLESYKQNTRHINYTKTDETTSDVVNFVKYGFKYPPNNNEFHFTAGYIRDEGLLGLFELNADNADDLTKLDDKIATVISRDSKLKLGLKLNEVYEFRGDIPEKTDEILKYNKSLTKFYTRGQPPIYTMEELMEIIYLKGDIKKDEYVIIFDNSCKGLREPQIKTPSGPRYVNRTGANTYEQMSASQKHNISIMRLESMERSLNGVKGGTTKKKQKRNKKKQKRNKKETKRNKITLN